MFQFVKTEKKEEEKEQKSIVRVKKKGGDMRPNKKICEWNDTESEKENDSQENRKIFQNFYGTVHSKKQLVSRLISSRKYKQRPLKKVLMSEHQEFSDVFANQEFIIQTAIPSSEKK